jgi:O-antigen/teichoic acid export membrane protein
VATLLLLPQLMTTADYGRLMSVLALALLGGAVVEMGLNWFEMRFIAPAWRGGDVPAALKVASSSFFTKLLLALLVTLLLVVWLGQSPGLALRPADLAWIGVWLFARFSVAACAVLLLPLGLSGAFMGLETGRALVYLLAAGLGYGWAGLSGAFAGLALTHVLLLMLALSVLNRHLPVRPGDASMPLLWRERHYLGWTAVAAILAGVQFWLPVFLVGGHLSLAEAALLGLAVQGLGILHGLGSGLRQGLMPIIADLNAGGDSERSLMWLSLQLRLLAAAATGGLLLWLIVGPALLSWLLQPDYAGLYQAVALMLVAFVLLSAAASCDGLLNLRGHAALSVANLGVFALLTVLATLLVIASGWSHGAWWVAGAYVLAAAVLAVTSLVSLGLRTGLWLPVGRVLGLLLPGLLALPLAWLDWRWPWWSVVPVLLVFTGYVIGARLIGLPELRRIVSVLRG